MEVILIENPGGIEGEYLFNMVPSGKPLPNGSKVRGNFRLNSVHKSFQESKLMVNSMNKRVGNTGTQRKLTSCHKSNERIKESRTCTI